MNRASVLCILLAIIALAVSCPKGPGGPPEGGGFQMPPTPVVIILRG